MGKRQRQRARNTTLIEADTIDLTEAAFDTDGAATILVASPGWGTTGYYPPEILARDAATAFPAGTHMYLDHAGLSEAQDRGGLRSVRDLAATFTEAGKWLDNGAEGPGVYAQAQVLPAYRDAIKAMAPHIGVSMKAPGLLENGMAEGKHGSIVKKIGPAHSVDFVAKAGRGGKIATLLEGAGIDLPDPLEESAGSWFEAQIHTGFTVAADDMYGDDRLTRPERIALSNAIGSALDAFTTAVTEKAPQLYDRSRWDEPDDDGLEPDPDDDPANPITPPLEEATMPMTDQERQELTESITASVSAAIGDQLAEAKKEATEAKAGNAALVEALNQSTARDHARTIINSVQGLPETAKARAIAVATATVPLTEAGALDTVKLTETATAAVKAEVAYLQEAGVNLGGIPTGVGGTAAESELTEAQLDAELEASFVGLGLSESAAKTAVIGR